jgi:predicted DNA binding CopG/RHH family protein
MYVCMHVRLAIAWIIGLILFIFWMQEFANYRSASDEYENYNSKILALRISSKNKMAIFSKAALTLLLKYQQFMETVFLFKM